MSSRTKTPDSVSAAANWTRLVPQLTLLLSAAFGIFAVMGAVIGAGLPGQRRGESLSVVSYLPPREAALTVAVIAFAACALAAVMTLSASRRYAQHEIALRLGRPAVRHWLTAGAAVVILLLFTTIPSIEFLALIGYLPMLVVGAFFDTAMREALIGYNYAAVLVQSVAILTGFGLMATTVVFNRVTVSRGANCGRGERPVRWMSEQSVGALGRVAVSIAIIVPLIYAFTRYAWLAGIPLGVDEEMVKGSMDGRLIGAGLATCAALGALLTVGLLRPWGERFPRWFPGIAGRRVPISLAVIPAAAMSVIVTSAGIGMIAQLLFGGGPLTDLAVNWGAVVPTYLWPVWGVALAASTLAYAVRRRTVTARSAVP